MCVCGKLLWNDLLLPFWAYLAHLGLGWALVDPLLGPSGTSKLLCCGFSTPFWAYLAHLGPDWASLAPLLGLSWPLLALGRA